MARGPWASTPVFPVSRRGASWVGFYNGSRGRARGRIGEIGLKDFRAEWVEVADPLKGMKKSRRRLVWCSLDPDRRKRRSGTRVAN